MIVFKRKNGGRKKNLSESSRQEVGFSIECRLADSLQMLSCPCDLSAGLLREAVGGRELVIF